MRFPWTPPEGRLPTVGVDGVRSHRVRRLFISAFVWGHVLLAAWVIAGYFLIVTPVVDRPAQSEAVIVLAPAITSGRLAYAVQLMSEGYGAVLVISLPDSESGTHPPGVCEANQPYPIICFSPDPVTTQGEARAIQRLSEENQWRTITVVTDESHITRARTLIGRCYSHELNMAAVKQDLPPRWWTYRFVYESAALAKASVDWGC